MVDHAGAPFNGNDPLLSVALRGPASVDQQDVQALL
jgi:hypothetical protein